MNRGFFFNAHDGNSFVFNGPFATSAAKVANIHSGGSHGGGFTGFARVFTNAALFGRNFGNATVFNSFASKIVPGGPGSPELNDNTLKVLRVGDIYLCPIHGPNPIVTGSQVWFDNGHAIARLGDKMACGASITTPVSPEWSSD